HAGAPVMTAAAMSVPALLAPPPGLRVLITAGAGGIGRVMAQAFRDAGARVHVCDVDEAALARLPEGVTGERADVADAASVGALVKNALDRLGGLDVLVNNAGLAGPTATVEAMDEDDWRRTVDVNLTGQFLLARACAAALRDSRGALINLASVAGRLGFARRAPYAATKWGVVGLTKSLAIEWGGDGVRVNAILPGIVRGPRIEGVIRARAEAKGVTYEQEEADTLSRVSLGAMVDPEEIAAMALFLCSPGGRSITGQALSVCGDVQTLG
ncbi:MAG: SDR family oxidoreductase, partial [Rubrimonas sp.]